MDSQAGGQGCAACVNLESVEAMRSGAGPEKQGAAGPSADRPSQVDEPTAQAAVFTFSAATAKRFDSGWAASPASFIIASVFFDASATYESNTPRT
jgi:hypothetical protein